MFKHKVFFQSWKSSMCNCFGWRSLFCIVQWAFLHECWDEKSKDHMMTDNRLCLVFVASMVWAEHTRFQENALNKCVAITLQPLLYDGDRGSLISGNNFLYHNCFHTFTVEASNLITYMITVALLIVKYINEILVSCHLFNELRMER